MSYTDAGMPYKETEMSYKETVIGIEVKENEDENEDMRVYEDFFFEASRSLRLVGLLFHI